MQDKRRSVSLFLGIGAALGWVTVLLQLYLHISNRVVPMPETIIRFFSYFTIQANLLIAFCYTVNLLSPRSATGRFFARPATQTGIALYIIVVGLVYNLILRSLWDPQGLQKVVDELLHTMLPLLFTVYWLSFVPKSSLTGKNIWPWLIFPLVYCVYTFIRGAYAAWYPYPFLDLDKLSHQQVIYNVCGVILLFLVLAFMLVGIAKWKTKAMLLCMIVATGLPVHMFAQHAGHHVETNPAIVGGVEPQPLLAQAIRLKEALSFLGSSLKKEDARQLTALQQEPLNQDLSKRIQAILDPYCLVMVQINPESRVKLTRGPAKASLIQDGWVSYLVKVTNEAGVTAALEVQSPNAARPMYAPSYDPRVQEKKKLTKGQVANRFLEMQIYRNRPMLPNLSGLKLEYAILQVYSKDAGQREAEIGFNVGQGTQDIGFRNAVNILFNSTPSVKVNLHIKDEDGSPSMASLLIADGIERTPAKLVGIYPLPSRRVAAYDEYPDFFFQPQIYRFDGEHVQLPPGKYTVTINKGPEYTPQTTTLTVPEGVKEYAVSFQLHRWIDLSALGWYSADHHVHAAGCSHYDSPEEGVKPLDMWRQELGEGLQVAAVLAWGPSWYHQKTFFTGKDDPLSTRKNILRNDVEVSGFPSSHAGHVVLLRLREDDYPGTTLIEEWPSWTLPVFKWARSQNAVAGYAHSGWGLEPTSPTSKLPNYVKPKMDGIGANEYIVTVTQALVDFYSAGDTPAPWELNMWYHTLNCGFTTRLSGETDFPCIFDERVGIARSYFKPEGPLSYDSYVEAIKKGRSYVSEGNSHILDFAVNGLEAGVGDSRLTLNKPQSVRITAKVAAHLPAQQREAGAKIAASEMQEQPYWSIERARIGTTQKVRVELIVNGEPVDTTEIDADDRWKDISFDYPVTRSCWAALRIYPSCHTNPVFMTLDGKPILELKSAKWCREAVDQCWQMKQGNIRPAEQPAARAAYDQARNVYDQMISSGQRSTEMLMFR